MTGNSRDDNHSRYVTELTQTNETVSAITAIIEAVSRRLNKDPLECDPLYNQINPEALNSLINSTAEAVSVEFEYEGYWVQVKKEPTTLTVELCESS